MGGCMGQKVGSGQMTNLIKLELINIIWFCLKIYNLLRHPYLWVDGCINGWAHVKPLKSNKSWPNWDNSILFEDLWFVETPAPMGGCMGQKVGSGQMTNLIKLELINIIWFCLKIYNLLRHPYLWVDGCINGWAHVKPLKSNKSWPNWDNSIMDILDILLDILLKPPQPFIGLFFLISLTHSPNDIGIYYMQLVFQVTSFWTWHFDTTYYLNHISPGDGYF